jgi:hypothetical protein
VREKGYFFKIDESRVHKAVEINMMDILMLKDAADG